MESVKRPAMNNAKTFSHHRGKAEIRQNAEVQFLNELISEFAQGVATKVVESISEGTWDFRRKESTKVTGFFHEWRIEFIQKLKAAILSSWFPGISRDQPHC
jgi:hypothetical protein